MENPNDREGEQERIIRQGRVVFRWDANSDCPAGGGYCVIRELGGRYAVNSDLDMLDCGPFASLREALEKSGAASIGPAVGEIECSEIEPGELLRLLSFFGEPRT